MNLIADVFRELQPPENVDRDMPKKSRLRGLLEATW